MLLEGDSICRLRECNVGNLITDAFVEFYMRRGVHFSSGWADNAVAVYVGGGIRTTLDERAKNGTIALEDMLSLLPFSNPMVVLVMSGTQLQKLSLLYHYFLLNLYLQYSNCNVHSMH